MNSFLRKNLLISFMLIAVCFAVSLMFITFSNAENINESKDINDGICEEVSQENEQSIRIPFKCISGQEDIVEIFDENENPVSEIVYNYSDLSHVQLTILRNESRTSEHTRFFINEYLVPSSHKTYDAYIKEEYKGQYTFDNFMVDLNGEAQYIYSQSDIIDCSQITGGITTVATRTLRLVQGIEKDPSLLPNGVTWDSQNSTLILNNAEINGYNSINIQKNPSAEEASLTKIIVPQNTSSTINFLDGVTQDYLNVCGLRIETDLELIGPGELNLNGATNHKFHNNPLITRTASYGHNNVISAVNLNIENIILNVNSPDDPNIFADTVFYECTKACIQAIGMSIKNNAKVTIKSGKSNFYTSGLETIRGNMTISGKDTAVDIECGDVYRSQAALEHINWSNLAGSTAIRTLSTEGKMVLDNYCTIRLKSGKAFTKDLWEYFDDDEQPGSGVVSAGISCYTLVQSEYDVCLIGNGVNLEIQCSDGPSSSCIFACPCRFPYIKIGNDVYIKMNYGNSFIEQLGQLPEKKCSTAIGTYLMPSSMNFSSNIVFSSSLDEYNFVNALPSLDILKEGSPYIESNNKSQPVIISNDLYPRWITFTPRDDQKTWGYVDKAYVNVIKNSTYSIKDNKLTITSPDGHPQTVLVDEVTALANEGYYFDYWDVQTDEDGIVNDSTTITPIFAQVPVPQPKEDVEEVLTESTQTSDNTYMFLFVAIFIASGLCLYKSIAK